ncbi:MAG: AsmA-like C-terminal domain-containing protein [Oryzomonas sp.]|uniref:YhdP family protein n=1 Tax=Oryzomonas sp. TaxID=2855186 RepID=UPI0028524444|nr:AsmA-like C-terminal domain-containing protein [Oryzomonas sp.]MDR3578631.1 AsmA-like C-terminal domain-containing protein [Oryzomonas sp.]
MMRRSYIKISGILLLIVGTLVISLAFFLPYLLDVNSYRDEILASLQKSLNRKVTFSRGEFTWHFGPSFDFDGITVKEPDNSADFLKADRITVRLALMPLLEKHVVVHDVSLEGADIHLVRGVDGKLNIDDLMAPGKEGMQVRFHKVQLRHSTLQWRDMAIRKQGLSAVAANIDLTLDNLDRGHKGGIKLVCDMPAASGSPAHIALSGTVRLPEKGQSLLETELNGDADIKQAEIGRFWPYYGSSIPFANPGGRLDVTTSFKGTPREFAAKGKIRVNNAAVTWPAIFHATVAPRFLQAEYNMKLTATLLDVKTIDLSTDGFRIKGSVQVHDYAGKDPRIVAKASTPSTFRYEDVRGYVPYGIIPNDTSDYIEHKIKTGIFKLDTGVLDGRVSQIAHMEQGDNCNTLMIRGPVEKAVLSYGPKAPTFNNIKGTVELKGKDFNLIGMTGSFGSSPFKLQGSITEYNTDKQGNYPVRMELTPRAPEVAWLARIAGANQLDFSGASSLVLTGSGHFSAYRLDGEWDLKQAAYTYPGAIRKPTGMLNHLAFSSTISAGEVRLTSLAYTLPPLAISATALLKYAGQTHLNFDMQTNPFLLNDALPIMPMWQQYRPHGRVQAHIRGRGNPEDFSAMDYSGSISLNAFSFLPDPKLKPVNGISSTITFQGNSLETTGMNARYGDSLINLRGRVKSLKNAEAEITLASSQFFLHDLNLAPAKAANASIRRLHAVLDIGNGRYTINKLSGLYNTSNFSISGDYTTGTAPTANLALSSSNLDLGDLLLLAKSSERGGGEAPSREAQAPSRLNLSLKMNVESGKYEKVIFSKLSATLHQENGILYVQGLEAGMFDGRVTAKGRIAPGSGRERRYDLNFGLERVNAERLFQALDVSKVVTGTLSLSGDLTARGATLADLKRTTLGNVKLKLEKGTLRKFNVLSKMFSILNVSQLLKFQLPDMVSNGMPYNDIHGSFAFSDGSIATQNLFINSNAMNISIIGKADMVKEELNFTIGVQPLQTVDKIVNRIPVVGWLLTGKGKSVVTAYFEAKGKWSDPQVSAIPVKSMAKGAFDVFKRVFQLPVKLFTDTGDVILGK